ncbi:MAG: O-succinylbenzoic acid--CoA ligase [Labilithrix sp.]|nr:O-succinylbenzoic acid--CoA ligase [Labilithrix sp.]
MVLDVPAVTLYEPRMSTLTERWLSRVDEAHVAVHDANGSHAYRDVVAGSLRVAAALRGDRATLDGERVALLAGPGASFVSAFFGVLLAGGTVVVLSALHPAPETRYFCEDAGVRTILVAADHASHAAPLEGAFTLRPLADRLEGRGPLPPPVATADTDPALQLYTSGTTGKPKGAVITHGNLAVQQALLGAAWGFSARDTLLHALPLHHMHGLAIALMTALGAGAAVRMTSFDAPAIWEAMRDATSFMAVPAMYHRLFAAFDGADEATRARWSGNARALRLATSGSAALPVGLAERWRALTGNIPLERFGMTEVGVGLTNPLDGTRHPGCVGFPLPTVETRIVGDDGRDGEIGELWLRGPSVFVRYHGREDETRKAFATDPAGGPPWFRTGDTVTREPSGAFKILGRTSVDILKSGGYKLSALEIEEVLREHPAVLEVAVVGVPDEAWGDRVVACIVPRPAAGPDAGALRAFAKERLAAYKVPKDFVFLDELPKNALGKVLKPALREDVAGAAQRRVDGKIPP